MNVTSKTCHSAAYDARARSRRSLWRCRGSSSLSSSIFFFSSRRRHTRCSRDWSSDVCSSDLLSPKHLPALLSLADALLRENHEAEALPYATRAVEVEPTSWRAHVILANVYLRQGSADAAVKEAERAMELGHEQAAMVQPVLAGALARKGEKERAVAILQKYLKEHPLDDQAKKLQEGFERIATSDGRSAASSPPPEELALSTSGAAALPLPLSWLPPDVDEKMPPVEPGVTCALEEVFEKAGKRAQVFVKNVERFTASEFLKQETIDKWGIAGAAETRKFNYVAAIEEPQPGLD